MRLRLPLAFTMLTTATLLLVPSCRLPPLGICSVIVMVTLAVGWLSRASW